MNHSEAYFYYLSLLLRFVHLDSSISRKFILVFTLELYTLYCLSVILLDCFQSFTFANNAAMILGHVSGRWKSWIVWYAHLQLYELL